MSANDYQVGGAHYQTSIQHWDFAAANDMDYFQGCITKYVTRWKDKNGVEDLKKALHYLEKYIELMEATETENPMSGSVKHGCKDSEDATSSYVNQDPPDLSALSGITDHMVWGVLDCTLISYNPTRYRITLKSGNVTLLLRTTKASTLGMRTWGVIKEQVGEILSVHSMSQNTETR